MKTKKILVVEDDQSIRFLLNHILGEKYEIESTENGIDALSLMQNGSVPDLIISDLTMPKMNGVDFIKNIRMSTFFKEIPLIVLSATDNSKEKINCLKTGADDYVVKPFNPEELEARVENILRRMN